MRHEVGQAGEDEGDSLLVLQLELEGSLVLEVAGIDSGDKIIGSLVEAALVDRYSISKRTFMDCSLSLFMSSVSCSSYFPESLRLNLLTSDGFSDLSLKSNRFRMTTVLNSHLLIF